MILDGEAVIAATATDQHASLGLSDHHHLIVAVAALENKRVGRVTGDDLQTAAGIQRVDEHGIFRAIGRRRCWLRRFAGA